MTDFNFIVDPISEPEPLIPEISIPEVREGNLSKLVKMTPRKFAQSVLDVFEELGGMTWLLTQATNDPRGFLDLLKKILPRNIQAEGLEGITVRLVDQYGNAIEIDTHRGRQPEAASGNIPPESGQLQIATGGTPVRRSRTGHIDGTPDVVLKETFN